VTAVTAAAADSPGHDATRQALNKQVIWSISGAMHSWHWSDCATRQADWHWTSDGARLLAACWAHCVAEQVSEKAVTSSTSSGQTGATAWHTPLTQPTPAGQALPQAPQLLGSEVRSVQTLLQQAGRPVSVRPAQTLPQAPQLLGSEPRVVQLAPGQKASPGPHDGSTSMVQAPKMQGMPYGHWVLHPPQ